jgi:hypothetical protein
VSAQCVPEQSQRNAGKRMWLPLSVVTRLPALRQDLWGPHSASCVLAAFAPSHNPSERAQTGKATNSPVAACAWCVPPRCAVRFFRQAKDTEYLKRTILAGLPPLPQRVMEIRMVGSPGLWLAAAASPDDSPRFLLLRPAGVWSTVAEPLLSFARHTVLCCSCKLWCVRRFLHLPVVCLCRARAGQPRWPARTIGLPWPAISR